MHRIDGAAATPDHQFRPGTPQVGQEATLVTVAWLNDVQENICRLIELAGVALVKGDDENLYDAIVALNAGALAAGMALKADKTISITAAGLATGGGTLAANRTITVTAASDAEVQAGTEVAKVVTPANLSSRTATTARTGLIELATAAEAQSWTDAVRGLTPATLAAAFQGAHQTLAAAGQQQLPGGLILKWGTVAQDVTNDGSFSPTAFPAAFPTACLAVFVCPYNPSNDANADSVPGVVSWTAAGFQARSNTTTAVATTHGFIWFAVGN